MSNFTWPSAVIPSTSALTWLDNTAIFKSPLSGTIRTETRPGGRWSLQLTVSNLKNLTGENDPLHILEAYLFKLNGAQHRATIKDHAYVRSSTGGVAVKVNGADQTGLTLDTDSWPADTEGVLFPGDRITLHTGQMIPITSRADTTGGEVTLTLAHPIRTSPNDDSIIEINNPTANYILTNKTSLAAAPGIFKTVMLQFEEALP